MKQNEILKIYGTDYKVMTKEILQQSDLIGHIQDKNCCIGIKPNLVSASEASWGATTHPEIVAGIIEYLRENHCSNIVMLEGSWIGGKTEETAQVCGYHQLTEEYGVPLWDMQKDTYHKVDCDGMDLLICDSVDKIDFLINVPVLKGHCQTRITCALKNMKGLIPNKEKRHFHALGLHKPIAHLNRGIHQDFIVVDHICGDLDFEDGGNPVVRNCIMTALDPVLMDAYVCKLLHYDVSEVPYITMAEGLGCGSTDLTHAQVRICDRPDTLNDSGLFCDTNVTNAIRSSDRLEDALPYPTKVVELQDRVEEVESCSACYGYLLPALQKLKEEGLLDQLRTKICIGQGYKGKTGKLGVGACTSGFEFCIKGCPPTEGQIYEALKEYVCTCQIPHLKV